MLARSERLEQRLGQRRVADPGGHFDRFAKSRDIAAGEARAQAKGVDEGALVPGLPSRRARRGR